MHKIILSSTLWAALMLAAGGRAGAQVDRFQGEWKSTNRSAHAVVTLDIAVHGDDVEVSAWAVCLTPYCDQIMFTRDSDPRRGPISLGTARAEIYATTENDNLVEQASALLVKYRDRLVLLELRETHLWVTVFSYAHVERNLFKHTKSSPMGEAGGTR
jgi:hypothetical protein